MKKLYSIIFSAAVLSIFAPLAKSQVTLPPYSDQELDKQVHYSDAGGLCYSKTISKPDKDGTYWITLESFVTGEVTATTGGDKPVDLILVLDVSSSMVNHRGNYSSSMTASLSYNDVTPDLEDYDTENPKTNYLITNNHVQLFGEKDGNNYYLYYLTVGGTQRNYLRSNGTTTTSKSNAASANSPEDPIVSNLTVYTGSSRIRELQNAVIAFIDEVYHNSWYKKNEDGTETRRDTQLEHAVAIVTYATNATTVQDLTVLTSTNLLSIKDKVNDFPLRSGTNGGVGIQTANTIFNNQLNSTDENVKKRYQKAARSIVMFTDGEQRDGWAAIPRALTSKQTHSASVFSVCLFETTDTQYPTYKQRMEYVSSNYPNAESYTSPGSKIDLEDGDPGYFFDASSDDTNLTDVFVTIAGSSTGGVDGDWGESTISQVDVVSADFTLPSIPEGQDVSSLIKIYVAPFKGTYVKNSTGVEETYTVVINHQTVTRKYLEFNAPETIEGCLAATDHDPIETMTDAQGTEIKPTATVNGNTITVEGFDYGANWCGPETIDDVTTYHGHKLIILIPIKMSSASTGGPGTKTNVDGSGLFALNSDGTKRRLVDFVSPEVNLPVNIRINKQGLNDGESAKFMIQRSTTPTVDNSWEDVTSVFVTRHANQNENDALTSIIGLPATDANNVTYVYRIVEEKWGWSYYPTSAAHKLPEPDGRVYLLTTDQDHNPFIFTNKTKDNIDVKVRHAESKVTNTFNENGTAEYDDSKDNKRKEIGEPEETTTNAN